MCLEDADEELRIVFFCEDSDWDSHMEILNNPAMKVLQQFAKDTDGVASRLAKAKNDDAYAEELCTDVPN